MSDNRIRLRWKAIRYTVVHVLELKQKNCIMGIKRKFSQPTQYYAKKRPCNQGDTEEFQMKMTIVMSYISADFSIHDTLTYFKINGNNFLLNVEDGINCHIL